MSIALIKARLKLCKCFFSITTSGYANLTKSKAVKKRNYILKNAESDVGENKIGQFTKLDHVFPLTSDNLLIRSKTALKNNRTRIKWRTNFSAIDCTKEAKWHFL